MIGDKNQPILTVQIHRNLSLSISHERMQSGGGNLFQYCQVFRRFHLRESSFDKFYASVSKYCQFFGLSELLA